MFQLWIAVVYAGVVGRVLFTFCWLWSLALRLFSVALVLPKKVINLLAGWKNWLGKQRSNIWNLVPHCVMWIIWGEHDSHIFEDMELNRDQLLALFAGTLFD